MTIHSFDVLLFTVPSVLITQLCPTLSDSMDCSLPGSSVHGILQARILECAVIHFSKGFSPRQGSNLGLLHCRQILYYLSHQGSPYMFAWCFIVSFTDKVFNFTDALVVHCEWEADSWPGCWVSSFGQHPQDYVYLSSSFFPFTNYVHLTIQNHKLFY